MFTGLIEEKGRLLWLKRGGSSARLAIAAKKVLEGTKEGDSVAVNGVCLTVKALSSAGFEADVMNVTLEKSSLGALRPGEEVNLERALLLGERLGGHLVSGHIDGAAVLANRSESGIAIVFEVRPPAHLLPYIVAQGSVALDGVSLTVAERGEESFTVSLIPHTADETALGGKKPGRLLNIETDIIGKYVESLLAGHTKREKAPLDEDFLARHGFV
ncbi:MAG: riboflavin synthase [Clostridiales bacterium]|nr:riboflavin synthase [Clostridiales bacterium]